MTTVADLVAITKNRYLLGGASEQRNKLAADYTAGGTTLSFVYDLKGLGQGSLLSVGLNVFYVWSVDTTSKTAVVSGGQNGSTDADADSGDVVNVSSRYGDKMIFDAINEEVQSLSSPTVGLFQVKTVSFTHSAALDGYDLTGATGLQSILEVRYNLPDARSTSPSLSPNDYRLDRNTAVGSGYNLQLFRGGFPGQSVNVLYKAGFDQYTALTQDATTSGLWGSALDILPLGAAVRLLAGREVRRTDPTVQGDARRSEEVPVGGAAASVRNLAALRQQRILEESTRLLAEYPITA